MECSHRLGSRDRTRLSDRKTGLLEEQDELHIRQTARRLKAAANRAHSADTLTMPRGRDLRAAVCSLMIPKTGSTYGLLRLYSVQVVDGTDVSANAVLSGGEGSRVGCRGRSSTCASCPDISFGVHMSLRHLPMPDEKPSLAGRLAPLPHNGPTVGHLT